MNPHDHQHLFAAQKGMSDAITAMEKLVPAIGLARQVTEFSADRRKMALSKLVVEYMEEEKSTVAAEHKARADSRYQEQMKTILRETGEAERTISTWTLEKIKFEAARSLLSCEKSLLSM